MTKYHVCQTVRIGDVVEVSNRYATTLAMALALAHVGCDQAVDKLPAGAVAGTQIGDAVVRLVYEVDMATPELPARLTVHEKKATA